MTRLYIIRHAEAEGNIFRRMDGHYDSNITCNGQRQIQALQKRFESVPIDAVYASDLFRTRETAKALYLPKGLPLHPDARFREIFFGVQEDVNFGWIERFEPQAMWEFSHAPERWHADGAEHFLTATDRFLDGLREVAQRHEGQTVAVFSHGGITGWALRRLFGDQMHNAGRCDNTGVCLLRWENSDFSPEFFYDNSHLSAEISTLEHQKWWRGTHEFNLRFRDPEPSDHLLFHALPTTGVVRIAVRMDETVGYLRYDSRTAELTDLYLTPEHRFKRMGDQLLGEAVCPLRALGHKELTAPLPADNDAARAFFLHHGCKIEDGFATYNLTVPKL